MSDVPAARADANGDQAPETTPSEMESPATPATTVPDEDACEFDPDESSFVDTSVLGPDELCDVFDVEVPMLGADYQRAYALPDGRILWLFQDAFLATPHGPELVHNAGLIQDGTDFELLRSGTTEHPASYLFGDLTDRYDHWYWPLGGDIGSDGQLHVFVAELVEHGARYLTSVEPIATWIVTIDVDDLHVIDRRPAPDPSAELYGWSVVSAGDHTYLYAFCYRQFGFDPLSFAPDVLAHDLGCSGDVTVARLPRGDFTAVPEYWNGHTWGDDSSAAVPVIPCDDERRVNPTQVAVHDGWFVAVTKEGDWWGNVIYLDVAPAPQGPWRTYWSTLVRAECEQCNTYFASIVPFGADDESFVIALSCNVWGGDDLEHYNPTFMRVPAPTDLGADVQGGQATPGG